MNKLISLGIPVGLILAVVSFIRYWAIYPDIDKMIIYTIVGLLIAFVSYLYDKIGKLNGKFDYFEEKVQDYIQLNKQEEK